MAIGHNRPKSMPPCPPSRPWVCAICHRETCNLPRENPSPVSLLISITQRPLLRCINHHPFASNSRYSSKLPNIPSLYYNLNAPPLMHKNLSELPLAPSQCSLMDGVKNQLNFVCRTGYCLAAIGNRAPELRPSVNRSD